MRRRAPMATAQTGHIPSPVGGLNTVAAGSAMPEGDCIQCNNLVSGQYGLRSRLGSREWCTGLTGNLAPEVRTLLPFTGSTRSSSRLFAATDTGIWDVTDSSTSPSQVLAFAVQLGEAGRGVCHSMTTAGGHFLLYADEENGYHVYSENTDTWTAVPFGGGGSEVTGVDPADCCFVMVWKSRVWFVEKGTANAWYLPAGSIFGTATKLNLDRAAQFRAGGGLVGLWNWTLDGGVGIDDFLVAISDGGDVAVYQGSDPSSADTFGLKGTWSAGAVPSGRRIATPFGGDLLLLSKSGIRPLSQLVNGGDGAGVYATAKISNLFSELTLTRSELPGWGLYLHPEDNALMVAVPTTAGQPTEQLVQSLWNRGWSRYRDLPLLAAAVWEKKLYFGTVDGRVMVNDGDVDGVTLDDPDAYSEVQWSLLTSFTNLGNAQQKQVQMIRPLLIANTTRPTADAEARYTYNLNEVAEVSPGAGSGDVWDSGLWDEALWADSVASQRVTGAVGMGVEFAIAIRGASPARTTLVGIDVVYTQGGFL